MIAVQNTIDCSMKDCHATKQTQHGQQRMKMAVATQRMAFSSKPSAAGALKFALARSGFTFALLVIHTNDIAHLRDCFKQT